MPGVARRDLAAANAYLIYQAKQMAFASERLPRWV